ncbi:hypothetical protein [Pararhodobacter sp. CCB-MM2]|uniref:hypothetical protein n=1 Tax=Pararhodobacter sp. CCB-MM2 TaxID=1786003 RepID=UPI00083579D7|nr:hypothetical protein [Pararhodobacter sp. CCB-MM2]
MWFLLLAAGIAVCSGLFNFSAFAVVGWGLVGIGAGAFVGTYAVPRLLELVALLIAAVIRLAFGLLEIALFLAVGAGLIWLLLKIMTAVS